jgi:transcriptional regulator with XRE-family HTH domain
VNSDNLIKRIRTALRMSQADFARLIGRSHQSLGNYERGGPVPEDVVKELHSIVAKHALADLALELQGDWQVQRVFHPGETIISHSRHQAEEPSDQSWYDMLHDVLRAENEVADRLVKSALIAGHKLVIPKPSKEVIPRKRAAR